MEDTYGTNEVNSLRIQNLWERLIFYLIVFFPFHDPLSNSDVSFHPQFCLWDLTLSLVVFYQNAFSSWFGSIKSVACIAMDCLPSMRKMLMFAFKKNNIKKYNKQNLTYKGRVESDTETFSLLKTWVVAKAAVRSEAEYPTEITEINT